MVCGPNDFFFVKIVKILVKDLDDTVDYIYRE